MLSADDGTHGDALVAVGSAVSVAAAADVAWTVSDRFRLDLAELSALERAAAALWDLRPLGAAVFAVGALVLLGGLAEPAGRLERLRDPARLGAAAVAAGLVALALVVVALAVWVAATGDIGSRDELGFVFTRRERGVTLATQAAAWLPLAAVLAFLARALSRERAPEWDERVEEPPPEPGRRISEEMEELWRERLAFSSRREEARTLLGRIQALESAGNETEARRLADEMRRL
jgi:hypothetical protein